MPADNPAIDLTKSQARSAISNGTRLLHDVDGRSTWARRMRDVMALHIDDLGGPDRISEAERSIVRRVAVLTTELERLEHRFATSGEAKPDEIDLYQRVSSTLKRLLETIGIKARPRERELDLGSYLRVKAAAKAADAQGAAPAPTSAAAAVPADDDDGPQAA